MAKKKTKKGCGLGRMNVGLIVLAVAMLALVANYALAGTTIRQEIINLVAEKLLGQINEEEVSLGAIPAPDRSTFSGFTSINVKDELRFGDDTYNFTTDGFSEGYKVLTLSATSSVSELNNTGETLYVYDGYVRIQTATTTDAIGIEYLVGTSSVAVIASDGGCGATGACALTTSGMASILKTGALASATVVADTYFKVDFAGTDTGYIGNDVVPVRDGEYITCYASSTTAYKGGATQAAQCVVRFYTLDD